MSTKNQRIATSGLRSALLATAALTLSTAAFAQSATVETVTVTGTLIQGNTNLVSPVTVIDTSTLDKSGISSIQGALQQTLANNGPAVTNSWTANGNFAQGASGISLRGMTTNSTLVMFDGMRASYYPLADDGTRNFVDLNTIPDEIVENIQILKDGASSSYGADAIAGVINIVTKKEFQGLSARAEGGISDRGDAATWRMSVVAGIGDLGKDHVNFYLASSYYHSDVLYAKSRPYPFNSYDWSNVCYKDTVPGAGTNCAGSSVFGTETSRNTDDSYLLDTRGELLVRPGTANADGTFSARTGSIYQNLNPNCPQGTNKYTLTAADKAGLGAANPDWVCQIDYQKRGGVIEPAVTRFGLSGHSAFILPNSIEGWVEANFMQTSVGYPVNVSPSVYGAAPAGIFYPQFRVSGVGGSAAPTYAAGSFVNYLPNWVCAARTNCATAGDRKLNPNNPFANKDTPTDARIVGRLWDITPFESTRNRTYRVAGGLTGSVFGEWKWDLGVTASHVDLKRDAKNYIFIQHLIDLERDGNYNFLDSSANNTPLAALGGLTANQYLMPENVTMASSDLAQVKFSVTAPLFALPGGDFTVVAGTSIHYEAVDSPSANSDINGPSARYLVLNAFGTKGSRDVYAGFFEINAPIIEEFVINASGRYDAYSTGQSSFSPKIGFWSKPADWAILKGTYSEGFRIPSFGEANAIPTTGYVSSTSSLFSDDFLKQYGCTLKTFSTACPTYLRSSSYGSVTQASPNLKPENSRSWVADLTLNPLDEVTVGVTYYNIKKTNAIAALKCGPTLQNYYGQAKPADPRCRIVADTPDINFPNATPRVSFIYTPLVNADAVRTAGWDFDVTYDGDLDSVENFLGVADLLGTVHANSSLQATFIQNLDTKFTDGTIERYDGTLGNNNLTAGTGTPKWRGQWQTTFSGGDIDFTSTLNWVSGYNVSAMDQGNEYRECGILGEDGEYKTGMSDLARSCRTADYFTWDLHAEYKLNSNFKLYGTVLNVLDAMPPVDTIATYGQTGYNVVATGDGILGRYLKLGVKVEY